MEITPENLIKQLHNDELHANVILLFGEETYYRSNAMEAILKYVFQDVEEADRAIDIFEKDTDLRELANAVNTYPFFGGRSLIVLKDDKLLSNKQESDSKQEKTEQLLKILSDVPEYCTVVINIKSIDKRSKLYKFCKKELLVCECTSFRPNAIEPWLKQQAARHGAQFTSAAVGLIMEYLAPVDKVPLQLLMNEIEKLSVYAGDRKVWDEKDIETIFTALPEVSNFSLTNAVCEKKLPETLELLAYERKKGTSILLLCAFLAASIRRLAAVKELQQQGYGQAQIAAELSLAPFIAGIVVRQAKKYEYDKLRSAVLDISALNVGMRQGGRQYELLEEILLRLMS